VFWQFHRGEKPISSVLLSAFGDKCAIIVANRLSLLVRERIFTTGTVLPDAAPHFLRWRFRFAHAVEAVEPLQDDYGSEALRT
jgi:hypothetical protein